MWKGQSHPQTATLYFEFNHLVPSSSLFKLCMENYDLKKKDIHKILSWSVTNDHEQSVNYAYVISVKRMNNPTETISVINGVMGIGQETRNDVFNNIWSSLRQTEWDYVIHWSLEKNQL
jgi:hypothetical protein